MRPGKKCPEQGRAQKQAGNGLADHTFGWPSLRDSWLPSRAARIIAIRAARQNEEQQIFCRMNR